MIKGSINPNAAAEGLKEMLSKLSVTSGELAKLATTVEEYSVKDTKKFTLNSKEGKVCIAKNNVITISLQNANESDVKEIIRRLLTND